MNKNVIDFQYDNLQWEGLIIYFKSKICKLANIRKKWQPLLHYISIYLES